MKKQSLKPIYNASWFPLIAFSYYNLELLPSGLISLFKPTYQNRFDDQGNYAYPNHHQTQSSQKTKVISTSINNPILKEFEKICKQNNIELILYISPLKNKKIIIKNCPFTMINHSQLIQNDDYFYDHIHVNKKGRKKVSHIFSTHFLKFLSQDE